MLHRRHVLDPGVINHNIHAAKLRLGVGHHRLNLLHIAQVGSVVARRFADLRHFCARGCAIAKAVENQLRAGFCQHLRDP
jgi:hypothetical protein